MSDSPRKDDESGSSSSDSDSDTSSSSDKSGGDDDEFGHFGSKPAGGDKAGGEAKKKVSKVDDQHYDEAMSVSEDEQSLEESGASPSNSPQNGGPAAKMAASPAAASPAEMTPGDQNQQKQRQAAASPDSDSSSDSSSDEEDNSSGGGAGGAGGGAGGEGKDATPAYNPNDFRHLSVSSEIQDLFDYIGRFKPTEIELETKLKPFIPDFIPAVGEIDAFIKIEPPDGTKDGLGLIVLDEPAANQSDPTVLDLQLRVVSKKTGLQPMTVRSIENADKNPKKISTWITNIEDVHRKKPPPTVNYSKAMPEIEALMQVWSPQFEEVLKNTSLPLPGLDLTIEEYTRVVCALLDIPVYEKVTESLHVLFTLYAEFKNNSHFAGGETEAAGGNPGSPVSFRAST